MDRYFLLLVGIILVLSACSGTDSPRSPETAIITPNQFDTATNTYVMTVAPNAPIASLTPVCGQDVPRTRMIVGEHGIVLDDDPRPLNVRVEPGTEHEIVDILEIGEVFLVLDGPQCHGEYVWYYIQRGNLRGWIAEGDMALYYIAPYLPG